MTCGENSHDLKGRILYWDVIKCLAIFFVVWQHVISFLQPNSVWGGQPDLVASFILSFHMPLFMLVSGYFARSVFYTAVSVMVKRKSIQLLLPSFSSYFFIGILLIILRNEDFTNGMISLIGYCTISFWYLKTLFFFYVFASLVFSSRSSHNVLTFILCLLGGLVVLLYSEQFDSYFRFFSMLPYFVAGLLFYRWEEYIFSKKYCFLVVSALLYVLFTSYWATNEYDMYGHPFAMNIQSLKLFLIRTVIGLSGSVFLILFIREICKALENFYVLCVLGKFGTYTLGIYVFSSELVRFLQLYGRTKLENVFTFDGTFLNSLIYDFLICLPISIIIIMLSVILIKIIRLNRYSRIILLGEK